MQHFQVLEFDLHKALLGELIALFEKMRPVDLTEKNAIEVEDGQGVYQLFFRGELVYVGKTDLEAGLRRRLLRHCKKIRSRLNLDPSEVSFKAVRIYVFTAMDLEEALIKHYRRSNGKLPWNLSGFGSNDPGRNRDNSSLKENHFDVSHPIDLGLSLTLDPACGTSVASILTQLKEQLPYTLRFEPASSGSKKPHPDLVNTDLEIGYQVQSVREVLTNIASALGPTWQITALPGHVIIYRERRNYDHGHVISGPLST